MENIIIKACGIDVHQDSVTACIMRQGLQRQIKTFGTTTNELINLKSWLHEHEISHVAMESTGIFWRPVFNIPVMALRSYSLMHDTSKMFQVEKQMLRLRMDLSIT